MPRGRNKPSHPKPAIEAAQIRGVSPATIRRMREAAMAGASDSRLGHELGRLACREIQCPGSGITAIQESAGLRYAELRARWRAVTGTASPNGAAIDYLRVAGAGGEVDPDTARDIESAMDEVLGAFRAIGADPLQVNASLRAVDFVCDRDCVIVGHQMLLDLRRGLDTLAALWKMIR